MPRQWERSGHEDSLPGVAAATPGQVARTTWGSSARKGGQGRHVQRAAMVRLAAVPVGRRIRKEEAVKNAAGGYRVAAGQGKGQ